MDKGVEGLENWTIFMDVICVSFLIVLSRYTATSARQTEPLAFYRTRFKD